MTHCSKVFILVKRSAQHNFDCLNSSDVYKLPAKPVGSNMAYSDHGYPNDHEHKLAFLAQPMPNNTRVSAFHWPALITDLQRQWSLAAAWTFPGWRHHSLPKTWLRFGLTCPPAEWQARKGEEGSLHEIMTGKAFAARACSGKVCYDIRLIRHHRSLSLPDEFFRAIHPCVRINIKYKLF